MVRQIPGRIFGLLAAVAIWLIFSLPALALEPVDLSTDDRAIDLSKAYQRYTSGDAGITVTTAPDADGVISRIEVRSEAQNSTGNWIAFALANKSDEQVDRLIVAPHFRLAGSGLIWPDLGRGRIASITPSEGFSLDRQPADDADIFSITLNPGTVVTFVAELADERLPQLTLWEPDAFKDAVNSYTLYNGIVLGIAGLLALFLTILFVVKGSAMFPATAALAWAVLAYVCIDFGFIIRIFSINPGDLNIWRAGSEVFLAASMIVFLYAYLNLNRWNTRYNYVLFIWLIGLISLFGVAAFTPSQASGIARVSFAASAVFGLILIIVLALRGYDRAVLLTPTWLLVLAWVGAGWITVTGRLDNDVVQPALGGGLVLIILLISFTVMQHAFAGGTLVQGLVSDIERQALALAGSGDSVWDWDVDRNEVFTGSETERQLGLKPGTLSGSPNAWLPLLHPEDSERFKSVLDVMLAHRQGKIAQDFRLRAGNGQYHWMHLRARPVIGSDGEVLRCVGTINDVTDQRVAHERLLHDAVHDNLTGLPNRELFMDRLENALMLAKAESSVRPTLFLIDFDRFAQINEAKGLSVGDSILLTMARRLNRLLKPQDSLARLNGDQFALLLLSEHDPDRVAVFADAIKRAIKAPINFSDQEIFVTASIGLCSWSPDQVSSSDMVKNVELATLQAKRVGGDRIEPFRPAFRNHLNPSIHIESELRGALERNEMEIFYQPIVHLESRRLAGFEALMRWRHPRRGLVSPTEFIPLAEKSGLIIPLGMFAMETAADHLSKWQGRSSDLPVFVSVNISSRQLLRHDLINDVKTVLTRNNIKPGTLKLELTESLIMENPEHSSQVLQRVKNLGVGLSLDDFGTGYSSLSHLMQFPFDTIKIDRSFVTGNGQSTRPIILSSMINMAHDLGMEVVAEGAENDADADVLQKLGSEYAQGFLFGEAMTADAATESLKQSYPLKK